MKQAFTVICGNADQSRNLMATTALGMLWILSTICPKTIGKTREIEGCNLGTGAYWRVYRVILERKISRYLPKYLHTRGKSKRSSCDL